MQLQPERRPAVGYVVSTWPRLSQTFVLNEILALEQRGLLVRIFSTKDPNGELIHAKLAKVRAPATYLSFRRHGRPILLANLRIAQGLPGRYFRTLLRALRYGRLGVLRCFFQAGYLADLVRWQPVTHLHAHFATAPTLVAMFTHDLTRIPYTFTAHARDIYADTRPEVLRAEMQRARAVITISEYNRRYLSQISPESSGKVCCVDYGLDLSEFSFRWPRASDPGTPMILAVARLVEKKGLGDLISAADILRKQGHCFRVQIIGDGPLRQALESRVAELALQDCVTLLGAQPHEKVRLAYERASIFVLPCVVAADGDRDGLPNVLLEAMASGVPAVSTSVVGIPELIDSGCDGLVIPPNDTRALAKALERLLVDPCLRDRLARAARAKIDERFSIGRSAERLLDLFFPIERGKGRCLHV
jgi:glycosyltransferase involved in cell wall biosynthesis